MRISKDGKVQQCKLQRTPLAHWAYRYIGNGSEPTSCAVLIKIVGVPEMKDHESLSQALIYSVSTFSNN